MKRCRVLVLVTVALLVMLVPPTQAQAPATKVTISGQLSMFTTYDSNMSTIDADMTRGGDNEWYSRTRFRPLFTFEVGKAKAVMGLEIDAGFGLSGISDTLTFNSTSGPAALSAVHQIGQSGVAFDLNTDAYNAIEIKWLYLDFPFSGKDSLLPFIPVPTSARIGGQPAAVTYKPGVLFTGDFPGLNLDTVWTPNIKSHLTYVQIEENLYGTRGSTAWTGRGNDWAMFASAEYTPIKGLDLRPIYSIAYIEGTTSTYVRSSRGGVQNTDTVFRPNDTETRHTFGLDARWKSGNWSLAPTFLWQLGRREHQRVQNQAWGTDGSAGTSVYPSINAWLVDVSGGYKMGPLFLEAMAMYTPGNSARDNLNKGISHYQAVMADSYYGGGWSAIWGKGVDDYKALFQTSTLIGRGVNLVNNIGYDIYGRAQFGVKATYALSPKIDLRAAVTPAWTAEEVDVERSVGSSGLAPASALASGNAYKGEESYLGTEILGGFTWKFAPGLVFDYEIAHLFAGSALDRRINVNGVATRRDAEDAFITTGRIRYSF